MKRNIIADTKTRAARNDFMTNGYRLFVITALPVLLLLVALSPTAAAAPASMGEAKYVNVDGVKTRYFEGGRGEPMLLIHGAHFGSWVGASHNWIPIFGKLAEHYHVYALDKLGMGLTDNPKSDDGYTMQATVQHIYRFMQVTGLRRVHIVGHSRGALPVAHIALHHPEVVKTLVVFNSNTLAPVDPNSPPPLDTGEKRPPPQTKDALREQLLTRPYEFSKEYVTDEYVEAELEVARHPKTIESGAEFEALALRFVEKHPAVDVKRTWWLDEIKTDVLEGMRDRRLKVPTIIIWGYRDPGAPPDLGMALYKLVSESVDQAELHFFNKSGHFPYQEYPEDTALVMRNFIERAGK